MPPVGMPSAPLRLGNDGHDNTAKDAAVGSWELRAALGVRQFPSTMLSCVHEQTGAVIVAWRPLPVPPSLQRACDAYHARVERAGQVGCRVYMFSEIGAGRRSAVGRPVTAVALRSTAADDAARCCDVSADMFVVTARAAARARAQRARQQNGGGEAGAEIGTPAVFVLRHDWCFVMGHAPTLSNNGKYTQKQKHKTKRRRKRPSVTSGVLTHCGWVSRHHLYRHDSRTQKNAWCAELVAPPSVSSFASAAGVAVGEGEKENAPRQLPPPSAFLPRRMVASPDAKMLIVWCSCTSSSSPSASSGSGIVFALRLRDGRARPVPVGADAPAAPGHVVADVVDALPLGVSRVGGDNTDTDGVGATHGTASVDVGTQGDSKLQDTAPAAKDAEADTGTPGLARLRMLILTDGGRTAKILVTGTTAAATVAPKVEQWAEERTWTLPSRARRVFATPLMPRGRVASVSAAASTVGVAGVLMYVVSAGDTESLVLSANYSGGDGDDGRGTGGGTNGVTDDLSFVSAAPAAMAGQVAVPTGSLTLQPGEQVLRCKWQRNDVGRDNASDDDNDWGVHDRRLQEAARLFLGPPPPSASSPPPLTMPSSKSDAKTATTTAEAPLTAPMCGVLTTHRVLMLSSDLTVLAETDGHVDGGATADTTAAAAAAVATVAAAAVRVCASRRSAAPSSLAWIGASLAFTDDGDCPDGGSGGGRVLYLTRSGRVSLLAGSHRSGAEIVHVAPDRLTCCGIYHSGNSTALPRAAVRTLPLSPLEPLVAGVVDMHCGGSHGATTGTGVVTSQGSANTDANNEAQQRRLRFLVRRLVRLYAGAPHQRPSASLLDALDAVSPAVSMPDMGMHVLRGGKDACTDAGSRGAAANGVHGGGGGDREHMLSTDEYAVTLLRAAAPLTAPRRRAEAALAAGNFDEALPQLLLGGTHPRSEEDLRAYSADPSGAFLSVSTLPTVMSPLACELGWLGEQLRQKGYFRGAARCFDLAGDDRRAFVALASALSAVDEGIAPDAGGAGAGAGAAPAVAQRLEAVLEQLARETSDARVRLAAKTLWQRRRHGSGASGTPTHKRSKRRGKNNRPHPMEITHADRQLAVTEAARGQAELTAYRRRPALLEGLDEVPNFVGALAGRAAALPATRTVSAAPAPPTVATVGPPLFLSSLSAWAGRTPPRSAETAGDGDDDAAGGGLRGGLGLGGGGGGDDDEDEDEDEEAEADAKRLAAFNQGDFEPDDPLLAALEAEARAGGPRQHLHGGGAGGSGGADGVGAAGAVGAKRLRLRKINKRSVLASAITGGGDAERAVVAYYRFEAEHYEEAEDGRRDAADGRWASQFPLLRVLLPTLRDVGPYGHHASLLGAGTGAGGLLRLGDEECTSPMEQLKRQTQLALVVAGRAGSGIKNKQQKNKNKKKKKKNKKKKGDGVDSEDDADDEDDENGDGEEATVARVLAAAAAAPALPTCASAVVWGMCMPVNWETANEWDQQTMQLGFNQGRRHRNHKAMTVEMWLWYDPPDGSGEDGADTNVVLLARGAGNPVAVRAAQGTARRHERGVVRQGKEEKEEGAAAAEAKEGQEIGAGGMEDEAAEEEDEAGVALPWQWCLSMRAGGSRGAGEHYLDFRTSAGPDAAVRQPVRAASGGEGGGADDGDGGDGAAPFVPRRWHHVAVTIDANRTTTAGGGAGGGHVSLYLNGKVVASGDVRGPASPASETQNQRDSCALYLLPNAPAGFQATEVRVWAMSRAQHDLDAQKDWTLKLAKKKRGGGGGGGLFKGIKIKSAGSAPKAGAVGGGGISLAAPGLAGPGGGIGGPPLPGNGTSRRKRKKKKEKKKEKKKKKDAALERPKT